MQPREQAEAADVGRQLGQLVGTEVPRGKQAGRFLYGGVGEGEQESDLRQHEDIGRDSGELIGGNVSTLG